MRPYTDPEYRAALDVLRHNAVGCWRCGARATTPDHVPPLAEHVHVRGSGCCQLRPACAPCNLADGARLTNRRRRSASTSRLAAGSGWST